eukprot:TRINITY_DN1694_c0_g1_i1.p2 TRINITY_DN1694_c0_g1~~TRINITY_DN1694_c0_g1_i1.p2  ORF type:complete len:142 (-),score=8.62 TRINITY_DN1694_c0_g1_i1:248-673(-)
MPGLQFQYGLCDCCSDIPICCLVLRAIPCMVGDTYSRVTADGNGGCDKCCKYAGLSIIFLCAIPGAHGRKQIREKYGLDAGSGDCCIHCFCAPCAACQEAKEVKYRIGLALETNAPSAYMPPQQETIVPYAIPASGKQPAV